MHYEVGVSMDYRVNEVGALIFKPKEKDKPSIEDCLKAIEEANKKIESLENRIKKLEEKDS